MKTCKQCGRSLPDESFRPYVPRGRGINKSTVGRNTVCLECEKINRAVDNAWKKETKNSRDMEILDTAAKYYSTLREQGLHPIGAYCRSLFDEPEHHFGAADTQTPSPLDLMSKRLGVVQTDEIMDAYQKLLTMELTEEPDVYIDMLDEIDDKCTGPNSKVREQYTGIHDQILDRLAKYEDNYKWD